LSVNADVVRSIYGESASRWDAEALDRFQADSWHPDITWRAIEGAPDDVGVMEGSERLRRYYDEWLEVFDELTVELNELVEVGDLVVIATRVQGCSSNGAMPPVQLDYAIVYECRDGRVSAGREYATFDEALAAARRSNA
jgi:ketosteroid isomerase-like protein